MQQGHVILDSIEVTILDEADHMADLGFLPGVRRIMEKTPRNGQRLLFSATLDGAINVLVNKFLHQPVTHEADSAQSPVSTMSHHVLHVDNGSHLPVILDLTAAPGRKVVFTRTKHRAKKLAKQLNASGVPAVELHGNLSQGARTRNMDDFHSGRAQTLVATDIAARGIHVDDVALVIHADPPVEHKAYLHRSGRTARAGNDGTVVTMMLDEQVRDVRDLTRKAGIKPTTTRVQLGHPLLTELAPGDRSYAGGLVREDAPSRSGSARTPRPAAPAAVVAAALARPALAGVPVPVVRLPSTVADRARVVAVVAAVTRAPTRRAVAPAVPVAPVVVALVRAAVVAARAARARPAVAVGWRRQRGRLRPPRWHLDGLLDEQRRQRRVVLRRHPRRQPPLPLTHPATVQPSSGHVWPTVNRRVATYGPPPTVEWPRTAHRHPDRREPAGAVPDVASRRSEGGVSWPVDVRDAACRGLSTVESGSGALEAAAAAAELGDDLTVRLPLHRHVRDAAAPECRAHVPLGDEHVAEPARCGEGDVGPGRHREAPPRVAGEREARVGQGEDVAAVADGVTVDHVVADRHPHDGMVRARRRRPPCRAARGLVVGPHLPGEGDPAPPGPPGRAGPATAGSWVSLTRGSRRSGPGSAGSARPGRPRRARRPAGRRRRSRSRGPTRWGPSGSACRAASPCRRRRRSPRRGARGRRPR